MDPATRACPSIMYKTRSRTISKSIAINATGFQSVISVFSRDGGRSDLNTMADEQIDTDCLIETFHSKSKISIDRYSRFLTGSIGFPPDLTVLGGSDVIKPQAVSRRLGFTGFWIKSFDFMEENHGGFFSRIAYIQKEVETSTRWSEFEMLNWKLWRALLKRNKQKIF